MSIVNELFGNDQKRLENFQDAYFEEFFKRPSILLCLKQLKCLNSSSRESGPVEFRTVFKDEYGNTQHLLVLFFVNASGTYTLKFDLISEDYYDYGKYERSGSREDGFSFSFTEITKNLHVDFLHYSTWFERKDILTVLEDLFS